MIILPGFSHSAFPYLLSRLSDSICISNNAMMDDTVLTRDTTDSFASFVSAISFIKELADGEKTLSVRTPSNNMIFLPPGSILNSIPPSGLASGLVDLLHSHVTKWIDKCLTEKDRLTDQALISILEVTIAFLLLFFFIFQLLKRL
jgi:hypothetical protein